MPSAIIVPNVTSGQNIESNTPFTGYSRQVGSIGDPSATTVVSVEGLVSNTYSGALVTVSPTTWTVVSTPAAATQASAVQAAGATGVQHVCQSISFNYTTASTAGSSSGIQISLLDGSTVKWALTLMPPANSTAQMDVHGLNIVGTAATSMTLQFSAAGVTGSFQSCTMTGYDI
jgi:hypothetical protein